ncbi:MAG: hypothetical protein AAF799_30740 [Myxococcota bacterium]
MSLFSNKPREALPRRHFALGIASTAVVSACRVGEGPTAPGGPAFRSTPQPPESGLTSDVLISPAVFTTPRSWKRFHERIGEISERYKVNDQDAWQSWFESVGVDFRRESLVVVLWTTASISDRVRRKPPTLTGRTVQVRVQIKVAGIGLTAIGFHSLGLVADRSQVDAVKIRIGTRASRVVKIDRSSPLVGDRRASRKT